MKYTREQIEAMPAGKELDELIAEEIKGWKVGTWSDYHESMNLGAPRNPNGEIYMVGDTGWMARGGFKPSTSIASAFPLFAGKGWILFENPWNDANPWFVFADARDLEDWLPLACATTAEVAICRASLIAALPNA